jgi:hypothetical protein
MKICICSTIKCGLECWVATVNGKQIGQAWSRPGIVSVAKKYLQKQSRAV